MKRIAPELAAALLAYVALRAWILHAAFDQVALPMYELYPMGTLPLVARGHGIPLHHFYDNAAGQLLSGLLAIPAYALLGPSYLALKLVPFALGILALAAAWSFLRRLYGQRAALLGALLFAVGPTTVTKYSLIASGNHFETLPFTMLAVAAFWRFHALPRRSAPALFLAALAGGFAIFVFLGAITTVGLLALVHLGLCGWRRALRDLAVAAPGFLAGLLPLVLLNLQSGGRGLSFLGAKFEGNGGSGAGRFFERLGEFFAEHLPRASTFPDFAGLSGRAADLAFLALFALAWLLCLGAAARGALDLARGAIRTGTRAPSTGALERFALVPLVLYLPLTGAAYALSNLRIGGYAPPLECGGYRYFNTHFLYAVLLVAIAAARLVRRSSAAARAAGAALALAALATGAFNLGVIEASTQARGVGPRYEGHNVKQLALTLLGGRQRVPREEAVRIAESFPPLARARIYAGLGYGGAFKQALARGGVEHVSIAEVCAAWPAPRAQEVARGAGTFLGFQQEVIAPELRASPFVPLERCRAEDEALARFAAQGLAQEWSVVLESGSAVQLELLLHWIEASPEGLRAAVAEGSGLYAGRLLRRGIPAESRRVRDLLPELSPRDRPHFARGLGMGQADGGLEPIPVPAGALELLPAELESDLREGFERRMRDLFQE